MFRYSAEELLRLLDHVRFLPVGPATLFLVGGWWPPFEGTMYVCHDIFQMLRFVRTTTMMNMMFMMMNMMFTLSIGGAMRRSEGRWPDLMNWIST